jgi:hypothetical protein
MFIYSLTLLEISLIDKKVKIVIDLNRLFKEGT